MLPNRSSPAPSRAIGTLPSSHVSITANTSSAKAARFNNSRLAESEVAAQSLLANRLHQVFLRRFVVAQHRGRQNQRAPLGKQQKTVKAQSPIRSHI